MDLINVKIFGWFFEYFWWIQIGGGMFKIMGNWNILNLRVAENKNIKGIIRKQILDGPQPK